MILFHTHFPLTCITNFKLKKKFDILVCGDEKIDAALEVVSIFSSK